MTSSEAGTSLGPSSAGSVRAPSAPVRRPGYDVDTLVDGIKGGNRSSLARAITLVESTRADHRLLASEMLSRLAGDTADTQRIGITGVPGVGKSTFIDALGMRLIEEGHRVAVLAVDPTSSITGGSILGDKTRMARLAVAPQAYIRPSPTSGTLGGVAEATRETIALLEAFGFDVILVETVGVGQSEITVAGMTDVFCFLTLARTGDQLQGIKKGVLELADLIAVNKADGAHAIEAKAAARELAGAVRLIHHHDALWTPDVLTVSALEGTGLEEFWSSIQRHREVMTEAGEFDAKRRRQKVEWMWTMVRANLSRRLSAHPGVREVRADVEGRVADGAVTAAAGADEILAAFDHTA